MGKSWKRVVHWKRIRAAKAATENVTMAAAVNPEPKPIPKVESAPGPVVEEKKVEKPKETKKISSKGYRKKKKTTAEKGK